MNQGETFAEVVLMAASQMWNGQGKAVNPLGVQTWIIFISFHEACLQDLQSISKYFM